MTWIDGAFESDSQGAFKAATDHSDFLDQVESNSDLEFINTDSDAAAKLESFATTYAGFASPGGEMKTILDQLASGQTTRLARAGSDPLLLLTADQRQILMVNMQQLRMSTCTNILDITVNTPEEAGAILGKLDSNLDVATFKGLNDMASQVNGKVIINNLSEIKGVGKKLTTSDFKAMRNVAELKNGVVDTVLADPAKGRKFLRAIGGTSEEGLSRLSKLTSNDMKLLDELAETDGGGGFLNEGELNEAALDRLKKFREISKGRPYGDALKDFKKKGWNEDDFKDAMKKWERNQKFKKGVALGGTALVLGGLALEFWPSHSNKTKAPWCSSPPQSDNPELCPASPTTTTQLAGICSQYGPRYKEIPNNIVTGGPYSGTINYGDLGKVYEYWPSALESEGSPYNKYWEKTDGDRLPNTHSIPSLKTGRWPHYPPRGVDLSFLGKGCGECMESQTESGSIPLFSKAPAQASCETHRAINTVTDTFDKLLSNFCNILSGGYFVRLVLAFQNIYSCLHLFISEFF
jgi:hypothetical protein